jgi:hypothetical protein
VLLAQGLSRYGRAGADAKKTLNRTANQDRMCALPMPATCVLNSCRMTMLKRPPGIERRSPHGLVPQSQPKAPPAAAADPLIKSRWVQQAA